MKFQLSAAFLLIFLASGICEESNIGFSSFIHGVQMFKFV